MKNLYEIANKPLRRVIGLMSGTSADGMDAALVDIEGCGANTRVKQRAFVSLPYGDDIRAEILRLAAGEQGGSRELCLFNFRMGGLGLEAARTVCDAAGIAPDQVDLVGSHGQTLYHIPQPTEYLGSRFKSTLQLGEASVIAEGMGCPVVSDFRVRDVAAGGDGAPLVPYTEYLIYHSDERSVGLQNIGGIGNITVLPKGGRLEDTFAFDTGPGNMVIDRLVELHTGGAAHYDTDGRIAAGGSVSEDLLNYMLRDEYIALSPPKTTGREYYGDAYVDALRCEAARLNLSDADVIATATRFTAETIRISVERHCDPRPDILIVGGGGARNPVLMDWLKRLLGIPVTTQDALGFDGDAKEAVAFAILASECVCGVCNNVPAVTGAAHPVVMGKISI